MDIQEFSSRLRGHDWYYAMSESHSVWQSGENNLRDLKEITKTSDNHERLFDLASDYSLQMSGSEFEKAWRYAGGYLWAQGVKLSTEEAKNFVESKEDKVYGVVHRVNWDKINEVLKGDGA
jgi:hypothetical protein